MGRKREATLTKAGAAAPQPLKKTDVEAAGLSGPVKQVMEIRYKAHQGRGMIIQGKIENDSTYARKNFILTFNEKGVKVHELLFGTHEKQANIFNEKGLQTESLRYDKNGKLWQTARHSYNDNGSPIEHTTHSEDGTLTHKSIYKYNEEGKPIENISYSGKEERPRERTVYTYDEKGNMLSVVRYKPEGNIDYQSNFKYNEQGKQIDYTTAYTDPKMAAYNQRFTSKYNEQGDCIEQNVYDADGNLKNTYTYTFEYDKEGKRINAPRPHFDKNAKVEGETEQCENDARGNWIKKTTFYNKVPVNIYIREIIYFDEPSEKTLVHPLSNPDTKATEVVDTSNETEELTIEEAKWVVDSQTVSAENFSTLRYYALRFKEVPSVINYTGPNIEALALREQLKEMRAQEIHSYSTVWNGNRERLQRYSLIFPGNFGYLLSATGISGQDSEDFNVPHNLHRHDDGYVYVSQIQLLRPSEASGRRDEYFEEALEEYITLCSLRKKPEKPVINMIQVKNNSFSIVEHAVDDDFEIKDLDVNYGYGFQKFHIELMQRFNSSTKGLVLFHGQPGTGKTYYIRHLLRKMVSHKKVVIYMPPNMVDHLVEPAFMTFLTGEVQRWSENGNFCVLLIEDAEPLLAKRQEGVRIQGVTNLLNMSDGLLNDMLNLQIISTFNVDLKKLDSALLRPGRLVARKEFKALSELDANLLAQRLGIKHHFTEPATLGEVYAMRKNMSTLIHDVEPDKDASSIIDDLV